jgi:hypothetical protein
MNANVVQDVGFTAIVPESDKLQSQNLNAVWLVVGDFFARGDRIPEIYKHGVTPALLICTGSAPFFQASSYRPHRHALSQRIQSV